MSALLLALAALALIAWAHFRQAGNAGLPHGKVAYSDMDGPRRHDTLVSHRWGLVGRPDYVIETPQGAVPVEVKSRRYGTQGPYPGEKAQLYAYCLLLEDLTGAPVRSGVLEFADRKCTVYFGEEQRREIIALLSEMQALRGAAYVGRSHNHAGKCRGCGYRAPGVCGEAIRS